MKCMLCPECKGKGSVAQPEPSDETGPGMIECPICHGDRLLTLEDWYAYIDKKILFD